MSNGRPDETLLNAGIFTIPDAARLVGANQRALRVWVEGHKGKQNPIIDNQIGRIGRTDAVSFTNLMELRFVSLFVMAGVKLRVIRSILDDVKSELNRPHPFATNLVFRTDGKKIFLEIAKRNGISLLEFGSNNYVMPDVILTSLKDDVRYDISGKALYWKPRAKVAPNVIVHPAFSFGRPIIKASRIPTEALAKAAGIEGSTGVVAEIYEIPEAQVREAVRFERELRQAA